MNENYSNQGVDMLNLFGDLEQMKNEQRINITVGLKFKSTNFTMTAEVLSVHANTCEVILTAIDGHSWVEKDWNLQHTEWGFERGEYTEIK